ncbi:hypothetical protein SMD44_p10021 (plasmid) [Streptomyces alboflavus]|uniref:Uncharacterized protein n=1 Tax=Streptomyces alboflavus TaxID=67267 RepID=A0A291W2K1_9ACTN|nr:hypothetical protein [Streptomyces alboflavus]ATM24520.1 hypothetical protein SMD44_p10021 [Streptomyces alboflavus]
MAEPVPPPAAADALLSVNGPEAETLTDRERLLLVLLDLAPAFVIPCRPGGAVHDITVSRHRRGPTAPWQWAVHRRGRGLSIRAWTAAGQWWFVDDPADMLQYACWTDPVQAIAEAQSIAAADVARGHPEEPSP